MINYRNIVTEIKKDFGTNLYDTYEDFYKNFNESDLVLIFSTLHEMLLNSFKTMNERLPTKEYTNHFWAEPSRELIKTIDTIKRLKTALAGTSDRFYIAEYYSNIIKKCSSFLNSSGGSTIPEGMDKIELFYEQAIFIKVDVINVRRENNNIAFNKKIIGEGSYAKVYTFEDPFYSEEFVLKVAKKNLALKEIERFKREFCTTKRLNSPYIIKVYSYNKEKNEYIMELADITLEKYIQKHNDTISIHRRKNIIKQIFSAFKYIHSKNILHRDISINNVLLKTYDDTIVVKISDFGLVKRLDSELTSAGTEIKGSLNDYSGLLRDGFKNYDITHETYALTRLIAYVYTGKLNLEKIANKSIKNFIDKGTSPHRKERFQNIDEMQTFFYGISTELI